MKKTRIARALLEHMHACCLNYLDTSINDMHIQFIFRYLNIEPEFETTLETVDGSNVVNTQQIS